MSLLVIAKTLVLTLSLAHALAAARALMHFKAHAINYVVLLPLVFFFWPIMSLKALLDLENAD